LLLIAERWRNDREDNPATIRVTAMGRLAAPSCWPSPHHERNGPGPAIMLAITTIISQF
jgi:hypothetical protein